MGVTENALLWILLAGHFLGDFYLQWANMAKDKHTQWGALVLHAALYGMCMLPAVFLLDTGDTNLSMVYTIVVGSHFAIDAIKLLLQKCEWMNRHCRDVFLLDQLLHLSILLGLSLYFGKDVTIIAGVGFPSVSATPTYLFRLLCLGLFLAKPANILLKICNSQQAKKNKKGAAKKEDVHAGAIIGALERFLVAVLMLAGEYGGIGFIFAAKTLTRYPKITKEKAFSEYYLIGTLGSLLTALLATLATFPPI